MATESSSTQYSPGYLKQNTGGILVGVSIAFVALDVIFFFLRFYSRRINKTPWGWDDILLYPALLLSIGACILTLHSVHNAGVGQHLPAVLAANPKTIVTWAKHIFALLFLYSYGVAFPKLSILALYLRIFTEKRYRVITWALAVIIFGNAVAVSLTTTFQCSPISYAWDKSISHGRCINVEVFYVYCSLPNVITDVIMLLLPIPMILKLHTDPSQKLGLFIMFLLGTIGLISSCVRLATFAKTNAFNDPTWQSVTLMSWTDIEASIYMIAACLPSLRPLVRMTAQKLASRRRLRHRTAHFSPKESAHSRNGTGIGFKGADGFRRFDRELGEHSLGEQGDNGCLEMPQIAVQDCSTVTTDAVDGKFGNHTPTSIT